MTEEEMFIDALVSEFMEPEFQFPDIGRRVAELSIQNNDMTWRIWQAARATPADHRSDAQDAARYRWLKANSDVVFAHEVCWTLASGKEIYSAYPCESELDQAVDAAIKTPLEPDHG